MGAELRVLRVKEKKFRVVLIREFKQRELLIIVEDLKETEITFHLLLFLLHADIDLFPESLVIIASYSYACDGLLEKQVHLVNFDFRCVKVEVLRILGKSLFVFVIYLFVGLKSERIQSLFSGKIYFFNVSRIAQKSSEFFRCLKMLVLADPRAELVQNLHSVVDDL